MAHAPRRWHPHGAEVVAGPGQHQSQGETGPDGERRIEPWSRGTSLHAGTAEPDPERRGAGGARAEFASGGGGERDP